MKTSDISLGTVTQQQVAASMHSKTLFSAQTAVDEGYPPGHGQVHRYQADEL